MPTPIGAQYKKSYVPNNVAAPYCICCGYPRAQHYSISVPPGANGDQQSFIYLNCSVPGVICEGYAPDEVAGAMGKLAL